MDHNAQSPCAPIPQGRYKPAVRHGSTIYTAGMTPRRNGVLLLSGPVRAEEPVDVYRAAIIQAAQNALAAARSCLAPGETIAQILSLTVYVNAAPGYTTHAKIGDVASDYLFRELGEAGVGPRAAIGVASLPGDAPVEIQLVAAVQ